MLKKILTSTIIALIQFVPLAVLAAFMAGLFLNNSSALNQCRDFFTHLKPFFLVGHALFYLALFLLWPKTISFLMQGLTKKPEAVFIRQAIQGRYYLVGLLVLLECLTLVRS